MYTCIAKSFISSKALSKFPKYLSFHRERNKPTKHTQTKKKIQKNKKQFLLFFLSYPCKHPANNDGSHPANNNNALRHHGQSCVTSSPGVFP